MHGMEKVPIAKRGKEGKARDDASGRVRKMPPRVSLSLRSTYCICVPLMIRTSGLYIFFGK